jgi:transcriptional regulator with GAF, ATPase, and Fis domain
VGDEIVVIGPGGEECPVGESPVLVGRHPACDLCLDSSRVSALHCMLVRVTDGVRILDLQSTNGTVVNGARIVSVVVPRGHLDLGGERLQVQPALHHPRTIPLQSRRIRALDDLVHRVAGSDVPVLIEGESGVGKDGFAKRVHELSGRSGSFVPLNAAAIPPALAASELFGHMRGAFTGAEKDRDGAFLAADGGTLFLDEIAELPLTTQAELLRVVEQRRVRRVGANEEVGVDVRLVTATNRDLAALARAGEFRADLYHRICVVPLRIPPLRDRPDDLTQLAECFAARLGRELSAAAWEALRRYRWPGNIRELHNVFRRASVVNDDRVLEPEHLGLPDHNNPRRQMDRLVHETVMSVYHANGGNVAATARELGIHRATVYRHVRGDAASQSTV